MNTNETKQKIAKFLEVEFNRLIGDAYISECLFNELNEKDSESLEVFLKKANLFKEFKYKEGMFDAYQNIIKILEIE